MHWVKEMTQPPGRVPGNLFFVMVRFEIGKVYECRSICDYNCVWTYTVIGRTESTITIKDNNTGATQKNRILGFSKQMGVETVYPLGRYSMCPSLCADRARF